VAARHVTPCYKSVRGSRVAAVVHLSYLLRFGPNLILRDQLRFRSSVTLFHSHHEVGERIPRIKPRDFIQSLRAKALDVVDPAVFRGPDQSIVVASRL
jgi:hypothetical protein